MAHLLLGTYNSTKDLNLPLMIFNWSPRHYDRDSLAYIAFREGILAISNIYQRSVRHDSMQLEIET